MKTTLLNLVFVATALCSLSVAADIADLKGTWSGNWTPQGGTLEAMTVEFKQADNGALTGSFLTPVPVDFSKASFNPRTSIVTLEAVNQKSGKQYKLEAKVKGTELDGTLTVDNVTGSLRLIKWTFFGR